MSILNSKMGILLSRASVLMGVIATLALATRGAADSVQAPARLTLADAVAAALSGNATLKQAQEDRLSSLSALRVAGFATSYGISSTTGLERNSTDSGVAARMFGNLSYKNFRGSEASLDLSPFGLGSQHGSIALSLRHPLMQGRGRLSPKANDLLSARSDSEVQDKQLYIARQSTVSGVVDSYCNALLAREQIKVQERALTIAEEVATRAKRLSAEGEVAEIEVTRAEIRVAQTRDQLNLQRQSARGSLDKLMLAVGSGVGQNPELSETIPDIAIEVPTLDESMRVALEKRAELSAIDERISNQDRKLAVTNDSLRPKLDLVAGLNSTSTDSGAISRSLIDLGSFVTGLELKFPLDTRVSFEDHANAQRGMTLLHELRDYQTESVAEQVRSAYRSVESAQSSLEILSQNLKVTEDNLRLAQRMVEEGLDDNRNELEAQQELTRVQSELLSAKINVFLAKVSLRRAMGDDITAIGWQ